MEEERIKLFECCFNCEHHCKVVDNIYYHKCERYTEDPKKRKDE